MKHQILARCGRYALIQRETTCTPFIVACGYDEKDGTWAAAYYHTTRAAALKDFADLSSAYCANCEHVDSGCAYCRKQAEPPNPKAKAPHKFGLENKQRKFFRSFIGQIALNFFALFQYIAP